MSENSTSSSEAQQSEGYFMDSENAAEMARLMLQDRLLTTSLGLLPETLNISAVYRVLDLGCGPGGWLLELVKQFPHLQAVGIDISQLLIDYASHLALSQDLSTVRFRVMDAREP